MNLSLRLLTTTITLLTVFLALNWCGDVSLWTQFPTVCKWGRMKEEKHWLHILALCQKCHSMREKEKVRSGDLVGGEMETDEVGSPGAGVTLWTRCC